MSRRVVVLCVLWLLAATRAQGQSAPELFQQGVRAYQRLEYDAATALLRRAADLLHRDSTRTTMGMSLLDYLGAAEYFRGNRDSAAAVFRRVLYADPSHVPDDLVFPPDISGAFDAARRTTRAVATVDPGNQSFRAGSEEWRLRLLATSYHRVTVTLETGAGQALRVLYDGPVWDTMTVAWDGRDSLGRTVRTGPYQLAMASKTAEKTLRTLRVPLDIGVVERDTVPHPAVLTTADLLPERAGAGRAVGSLLKGIGVGVVAAALPLVLAGDVKATPARFAVGGAVGVAGIIGFFAERPGRPLLGNVETNRARRAAWVQELDRVMRENADVRKGAMVSVRPGNAVATGTGVP